MSQTPSSTLDSLPKPFVTAMRTLFDIMDDKHTGYVNFADIEHRWQDDGTKGLPKGAIESLQKVTPPNGMLSFERFCAGLKICLLRNQVEKSGTPKQRQSDVGGGGGGGGGGGTQPVRPPSAPLLDIDCAKPPWSSSNTAAIRPNNVIAQQRTLSMPQLLSERKENIPSEPDPRAFEPKHVPNVNKQQLYGPPKPPRVGLDRNVVTTERNIDRAEIRTALQNWQMGLMITDQENKEKRLGYSVVRSGRGAGDGKPSVQGEMQVGLYQKKANVRRREPRRHTLQNGIDYNMLKRMKQIEQEKDVLMQGLGAIEKARDWYLKQVSAVQDKMKYLGRMGSHMEQWSETQQERLELQRARVLEVNRHLATLTCSWERGGLPLHMNLAMHHVPPHHLNTMATTPGSNQQQEKTLNRLKQQNHLLTEEVSKKSERISLLEREKAALIRELLQMRAQPRPNVQEEAVF